MKKGVFIIESNKLDDEKENRFEGKALKEMLILLGINVKYFYIRTKLEFEHIIEEFYKSNYRYLHITCHADEEGIALTLENIDLEEFKESFGENLDERRLFLSACSIGNGKIDVAFKGVGFKSISAFDDEVNFSDAAAFWITFYNLLFNERRSNKMIIKHFEQIAEIFNCYPNHYTLNKNGSYRAGLEWENELMEV